MMFKTYHSDAVFRLFYKAYFFATIFLVVLSLTAVISGGDISATFCGIVYLLVTAFLSRSARFQKSPFSLLFCFFTFLYLNIPAVFILVQGNEYIFGEGLATVPFEQSAYAQSLPLGFLCLAFFWLVVWLAIISVRLRPRKIDPKRFSSVGLKSVLVLGLVVMTVTWIDNQGLANVILEETDKGNSLLTFIFFDHAYLVMTGLILFFKLNEPSGLRAPEAIDRSLSLIFIAFIALSFFSGSKAAALIVFMLFLVYPLCVFSIYPQAVISFPRPWVLTTLAVLAPVMFAVALIQRVSLATGTSPDVNTLLIGLSQMNGTLVEGTLSQILYRFSQGGIDRFFLIFQSFVIQGFDYETSDKFFRYMVENAMNLVLPGTPFPESYAPSSQLFPQVLNKSLVAGDIEPSVLIKSFNTQPYTIFGVFLIIFGLAAPIFLYFSVFLLVYTFNKVGNIFLKISILYFFQAALSSYGLEVAVGNSVHLIISVFVMYFLSEFISSVFRKSRATVKADAAESPT